MIHYGVTKTAQLAVSRGLAEAVAGTGITVNSVLPGPTKSRGVGEFVETLAKADGKSFEAFEKEFFEKVRPTSLIKRFGSPQEIASLVAYIAMIRLRRPRPALRCAPMGASSRARSRRQMAGIAPASAHFDLAIRGGTCHALWTASTASSTSPKNSLAAAGFNQRTTTVMRRSGSIHVKELPAPTPK